MPGGVYNFQGRAYRETGRVGSAPPHPASPSPILSRHGWTDVMAMKHALRGWSSAGTARCTLDGRHLHAGWPRHSASPPTPTADSRCCHFRTTLTTGPAGLPTPLHGPHCRTPVPGPSPVTARSHRCILQRRCALRRPFPANPLSQAVPPTAWSASPPSLFVNMSRVYSINTVNRLTSLFPHG